MLKFSTPPDSGGGQPVGKSPMEKNLLALERVCHDACRSAGVMANSRKKVHLFVILEISDFNLSICVTGKNLRLSFDMRHRAIGAGGEFILLIHAPFGPV